MNVNFTKKQAELVGNTIFQEIYEIQNREGISDWERKEIKILKRALDRLQKASVRCVDGSEQKGE